MRDLALPVSAGLVLGATIASTIRPPLWHQALGGSIAGIVVAACLFGFFGLYDAWFGGRNRDGD
jgi:hypothetical protein